jgi:HD superfamily phosphohydrolase
MHLAGEAVSRILAKQKPLIREALGCSADDEQNQAPRLVLLARLAGLLHDIGHAPFSHAGEELLFPPRAAAGTYSHEDYSLAAIRSAPIAELIDGAAGETGVTALDVCEVLAPAGLGAPGFVRELISSSWDVDKMDYLRRDAHFCGVEYGRFDLQRLIASLTLVSDPSGGLRLAVEEGGVHVLESLVLARYFMFTQVYFHAVRRAYDHMLTEFIAEVLQEKTGRATYPPPEQLEAYLRWDDTVVFAHAVEKQDPAMRNLAARLLARDHLKVIYATLPHPTAITANRVPELAAQLGKQHPTVTFWLDRAVDHPERFRRDDILIVRSEGQRTRSFAQVSAALRGLEEIGQVRLHADVGSDVALRVQLTDECRPYADAEV